MNEVNKVSPATNGSGLQRLVSGPATPKAHKKHTNGVPCGCWTGTGSSISCRCCGASYELAEVQGFPRWQCYDCGASVYWKSAERLPANPELSALRSNPLQRRVSQQFLR